MSKLGTVVHMVTSDEGTCTFPATDAWEATEIAPGGYEGAKEAIPESMYKKFRGAFKRGAVFRSFLEQTGDCIFGGELPDDPTLNDGRLDIAVQGWAKRLESKAGRLLYMTKDLSEWMTGHGPSETGPTKWTSLVDDESTVDSVGVLRVKRDGYNDTAAAAYGTASWESDNKGLGERLHFHTPGFDGLSRITCDVDSGGRSTVATNGRRAAASVKFYSRGSTTTPVGAFVALNDDFFSVDLDLRDGLPGYTPDPDPTRIEIRVGDIVDTDAEMIAEFGAWPAFRPSSVTNDYDTWTLGLNVRFENVTVYGIATSDEMTVSAGVRDIASRAGLSDLHVGEFGFNILPLDFKDGQSFAECLAYFGMLSNARHLVLDTGTRPYLEFDRFTKRIWTPDQYQKITTYPLPRFDRASFPYRSSNGRSTGWVKVIAEDPLDVPRSYGRVQVQDKLASEERAEEVGGRIVDQLVKQRLGGDFELSHVTDEDGSVRSAYLLHAGDTLRDPERGGRGRIARKSMTIRGVTGELESNYAPLDRLLEHEAKRMSR